MYKCDCCGAVFLNPVTIIDRHGLDEPPYEEVPVCPACGDPGFFEAIECDCCGEWVSIPYWITLDGHAYCADCISRVGEAL